MKKLFIAALLICMWTGWFVYQIVYPPSPKPGEVYLWTSRFHEEDPFLKTKEEDQCKRVLDYKEGYVLYIDSLTHDTFSMRNDLFMFEAKKLK